MKLFEDGIRFLLDEVKATIITVGNLALEYIRLKPRAKYVLSEDMENIIKNKIDIVITGELFGLKKAKKLHEKYFEGEVYHAPTSINASHKSGAKSVLLNVIRSTTCFMQHDIGWRVFSGTTLVPYAKFTNEQLNQNADPLVKAYCAKDGLDSQPETFIKYCMYKYPVYLPAYRTDDDPEGVAKLLNAKTKEIWTVYKLLIMDQIERILHHHVIDHFMNITSTILPDQLITISKMDTKYWVKKPQEAEFVKNQQRINDEQIYGLEKQLSLLKRLVGGIF